MKAIYAGSFDPFTNGHMDIIRQSCSIFEFVYITISMNSAKKRIYPAEPMLEAMRETIAACGISNFDIVASDKLVADLARGLNCGFLIRGLRNPNDYNYEENIAKINSELNRDLHTLYLRANNDVISSSFVKEIFNYDKDVSKYVSPQVLRVMREYK